MMSEVDPLEGLTIPEECAKIYGPNETLPENQQCFQVMYSRYPPYTIELARIDWEKHPSWIYSCGAVIGIIKSAIAKIGINCLQMKIRGSFASSYAHMNEVDFPAGIVPQMPPPGEAHKLILHWQLGGIFTSSVLGKESFIYNSDIHLSVLFDLTTWLLIAFCLIFLAWIEALCQSRSQPKDPNQDRKPWSFLQTYAIGLTQYFGIFMGQFLNSKNLSHHPSRLKMAMQCCRLVWALEGVLLLNFASNAFLDLLLQPPVSDRFKTFNQLLNICPDSIKVQRVAGDTVDRLVQEGKAVFHNFERYITERDVYSHLHEIYVSIAEGVGVFIASMYTLKGIMRWRLMTKYSVKHAYVTTDMSDERPYFLPTSRDNMSPSHTAVFDFHIQQWMQSGLYNELFDRAAGKIFPAMRDPEQEAYEAGKVVWTPIPLLSFWPIIILLGFAMLVPCLALITERIAQRLVNRVTPEVVEGGNKLTLQVKKWFNSQRI